jgi:hypothetical protein
VFEYWYFKVIFKNKSLLMKHIPLLISAVFIFTSFSSSSNIGNNHAIQNISAGPKKTQLHSVNNIASMKAKEIEMLLGKKLTLKEKIALKLAQLKIKKQVKAIEKGKPSKGQNAMVLGILSLVVLLIPFGILASIVLAIMAITIGSKAKKENSHDGKAQAGIIMGIVTLALIVLAIAIVVAILSSGEYWL